MDVEWNWLAQNILCMFVHRSPDPCMFQRIFFSTLNIRVINFVKMNVGFWNMDFSIILKIASMYLYLIFFINMFVNGKREESYA